jgi:primosomal protein N'
MGISQGYARGSNASARKQAAAQYTLLDNLMEHLRAHLQVLDNELLRQIEFDTILEVSSKLRDAAWETSRILEDAANSQPPSATAEDASGRIATNNPDFGYTRHHLNEIALKALELSEVVATPECTIANIPALLLSGEAGTGKSHLFCDVAKNRIASGLPTLLLMGEQFETTEPWQQISQMLGVKTTKDELLGALESAAQSRGARGLILIDALNEGKGKKLWHKYLAGMLTAVSRYP